MAQQLESAQQVADLRSQFFPTGPNVSPQIQDRTRLAVDPALDPVVTSGRVPCCVQCNCACK